MSARNILIGAVGIVIGIALAICFFRVASVTFQIISFLVWIAIGVAVALFAYNWLTRSWRRG
jgi:uncharacterized protein YacL